MIWRRKNSKGGSEVTTTESRPATREEVEATVKLEEAKRRREQVHKYVDDLGAEFLKALGVSR